MEKNTMRIWAWIVVGVLVVLAIISFVVVMNMPASNSSATANEPASDQDISSQDTGVAATSISYANALVKYADRRIQLDKNCQAFPNSVTYKDNSGIMIDNRSASSRTVKVGTTFTIKPYGFKIVVLPDVYLKAKTILVDCGQHQNVATIVVQE